MKTFKILLLSLLAFSLIFFNNCENPPDNPQPPDPPLDTIPIPPEHLGIDTFPLIVPSLEPEAFGDSVKFTFSWTQTDPPADSFSIEKKIVREGDTLAIDPITVDTFYTFDVPDARIGDIFIVEVVSFKGGQNSEPIVLTYRYENSLLVDDIVMGLTNDQQLNRDCMCDTIQIPEDRCIRIRLMEPGGTFTDSLRILNLYRHFFYPRDSLCNCLNNSVSADTLIQCAKTVGLKEFRRDVDFKVDCEDCQ